jgi:membrane-bound lytic murein transglycosylase MltF
VKDYFNEPGIDPLNRSLFAFAGYNAGPARVTRLRETAKKKGLNPDVWFGNVEVIAAREIGQETVQYVANIYKYYLAYKLAFETQAERTKARDAMKQSR